MQISSIHRLAFVLGLALTQMASAQEIAADSPYTETAKSSWSTEWDAFWAEFDTHRQRVAVWPEPFLLGDREAVRYPFKMMADNGWKHQNTFVDEQFTPDGSELTYGGKQKLRWILTVAPPHRRQIFVLAGANPAETEARVASIYQTMEALSIGGITCPVFTTHIRPRGIDANFLMGVDRPIRQTSSLDSLHGDEDDSREVTLEVNGNR